MTGARIQIRNPKFYARGDERVMSVAYDADMADSLPVRTAIVFAKHHGMVLHKFDRPELNGNDDAKKVYARPEVDLSSRVPLPPNDPALGDFAVIIPDQQVDVRSPEAFVQALQDHLAELPGEGSGQ